MDGREVSDPPDHARLSTAKLGFRELCRALFTYRPDDL